MLLTYKDKNKDIEIEVEVKQIITSKLKKEFLEIWKNYQFDESSKNRYNSYMELLKKKDSIENKEMESDSLKSVLEFNQAVKRFDTDIELKNDLIVIDAFKVIIDRKNLTTEQQKYINSNSESDFWQEQNLVELRNTVGGFCSLFAV